MFLPETNRNAARVFQGTAAQMWITQEAHLDDRIRSLYSEQFVFRSVTHTEAKTTETKMTQLRDSNAVTTLG